MATSLSRQLANLAVRPAGTTVAEKPSLLFPVNEAKHIDLETVFNIAHEGLEALCKLDERFSAFKDTLFSDESRRVNRESRTKDYNKQLDETISLFLRLLSPFFLLNPAHKTLEYLIRHYMIYTYNVDDLLSCILPYHETQLFVRVVQMINLLRPQNKRWQFLQPIQREGTPLMRSAVVALALKNHFFLSFVCSIAHNALEANVLSKTITSFYTAVLLEMLSTAKRIDTTLINSFLEYLLSGLRASNVEFQSASYMIVSQLSSCSTLIPALTTKLIRTILKHAVPSSLPQALLCIVCICQTQPSPLLPTKAFELLAKQKGLTSVLESFFEKNYDLNPFLKLILDQLVDNSFSEASYLSLTMEFLRELPLGSQISPIVTRLFDNYVQYRKEAKQNLEYEKVLGKLLRCIDNRFPIELDDALGSCLDRDRNESADWAYDFMTRSLPDAQVHTSLFLSLHHPDAQRRLAALTKLAETQVTFTDPQVRQHVGHTLAVRLIVGEDAQVTLKVLGLKFLLDAVPEDILFEKLTKLAEDSPHKGVQVEAFTILAGDFLKRFPEFVSKALLFILNQIGSLVLSSNSSVGLAFLQKLPTISHPLFSGMPSISLPDTPSTQELSKALTKIVSVFATNLTNSATLLPVAISLAQHELDGPGRVFILLALNQVLLKTTAQAQRFSLIYVLLGLSISVVATKELASTLLTSMDANQLVHSVLSKSGDLATTLAHAKYLTLWNVISSLSSTSKASPFKVPSDASLGDSFGDQNVEELDSWKQQVVALRKVFLALTPTTEAQFPSAFEPFLALYYERFLQTPNRFIEFFSYFWMTPELDKNVQTRALKIVTLFISSLDEVISNWESCFFALLVALTLHTSARVAALACIEALRAQVARVAKDPQTTSNSLAKVLLRFAEQVLESRLEFSSDSYYFSTFVKSILAQEEAAFLDNVRSESKKSVAKGSFSYQSPLENFLLSFKLFHASHFARYVMLRAMQSVYTRQKVVLTHPLLDDLIKKSNDNTIGMYESATLEVLLRQFNRENKFLFTEDSNKYFSTFISVLNTQYAPSPLRKHDPRRILLACVTTEIFSSSAPANKQALFQNLTSLTSLSTMKHPDAEAHALQAAAREVLANAVHDAKMLSGYLQGFTRDAASQRDAREWGVMVAAVLEVLRARATELADAHLVVAPLFALLPHLHQTKEKEEEDDDESESDSDSDEEDDKEGDEYTVQLALACVASILRHLSERRKVGESVTFPKESVCDVVLIVKILEESKTVATASMGVQALAAIGGVYPALLIPKLVQLSSLLAGSSLEEDEMDTSSDDSSSEAEADDEKESKRDSDEDESEDEDEEGAEAGTTKEEYRYNLLLLFVSEVLPPLIGHESGVPVNSILSTFLGAWERIPASKLLSFFSTLVRSVSVQYLSNLVLMLLNKHTNETLLIASRLSNGEVPSTSQSYTSTFEFCKSLCAQIGRADTVRALVPLSDSLNSFFGPKDSKLLAHISIKPESQHSRSLQLFILNFIISQLDVKHSADAAKEKDLQEQYIRLFEMFLVLLKTVNNNITRDPTDKHYQRVQSQVLECLDGVNHLLSIPAFITTIDKLLTHQDSQIRRRALVILNAKLTECRTTITNEEAKQFVSLTSNLTKIVSGSETDANKQSALLSLEILCRNFGDEFAAVFVELLPVVVTALTSSNHHIVSSSLLCIASLCSELRSQILPYMPQFFPQILGVLEGTMRRDGDSSTNVLLQQSCLSSLRVIFSSVSQFLSPYLGQILHLTTHPKLVGDGTSAVAQASASLLQAVAAKIHPRLFLGPLYAAIEHSLRLDTVKSIELQLDVLSRITGSMDGSSVTRYHKAIFKVLLSVFAHPSPGVEAKVIGAFMSLVLRLNEVLFKPLFLKVLDWAIGSGIKKNRTGENGANGTHIESTRDPAKVAFFYRLVNSLTENLKNIFVPYFAYIWDDLAHNIAEIKDTETFTVKKRKANEGETSLRPKILHYSLHSLLLLLKHDKEEFVDTSKFDKMYQPLVGQLSNLMGSANEYEERTYNLVIPSIVLLGAGAKEMLWKNLNYQICLATRHSTAIVKSAAVTCLLEFFSKIGDKLLPLVPETVQFISELLEDANPEVETKTQKFVKRVDELVGQQGGISSYL